VAPGERIPVDGTVRGGDSYVDQATITGESTPMRKTSGSLVYAGTINQSGALEVIAERLGRDTSFGKIIEAVERAERSFSKKLENHAATVALYFMYYNFGRVHQTLPVTPAMEAGLADHVWAIEEIIALLG
jgi:Cd2+/Zn2+-exporting ATPase/Cu+-exporting ATPase